MTLEDFFTLNEMNNGLTSPTRVRELVAVMQQENECRLQNAGDASRQWSAVASTIAATENEDCLDLFIQLDGLNFIDRWLKDAQRLSNDTNDCVVEESVIRLLQALEKLQVENEKSVPSGIWTTVKDLLGHSSSKIQDKAKALFHSWSKDNTSSQNVDKIGVVPDDGKGADHTPEKESERSETSLHNVTCSTENFGEGENQVSVRDEVKPSANSDIQPNKIIDARSLDTTTDHPTINDGRWDHSSSSSFSYPANENQHDKLEAPVDCLQRTTSTDFCSSVVAKPGTSDGLPEMLESDSANDVKQAHTNERSTEKADTVEESKPTEDRDLSVTSITADILDSAVEARSQEVIDAVNKDLCQNNSSHNDVRAINSVENGSHGKSSKAFITEGGDEYNTDVPQNSSSNERNQENHKSSGTFFSRVEVGSSDRLYRNASDKSDDHLANDYTFAKSGISRDRNVIKKSGINLDCGMVDPLEFARQVAIEVQREVVDRGEQSCSSEKIPEGNIRQPDSPDSIGRAQSCAIQDSPKGVGDDPELSEEGSVKKEELASMSGSSDAEQINGTQDMETSQLTREEANLEKGHCSFDLNEEICSEDTGHPGNQISTPISVVSASRAAAVPGLPVAPLQFEGNLGWKGSAATSAFRPASPRRTPEDDKALSNGGSSSSSKQRSGCLDFDLNVAESGDDRIADVLPDKQVLVSSSVPSGESSLEASSRRSEPLELDLNRASEDCDAPSDWRAEKPLFHQMNGHHRQSHSSSSSSKQPSLRNINLNDEPDNASDNFFLSRPQNLCNPGGSKLDDTVISIMGKKVGVNCQDPVPQTLPFTNGKALGNAFDFNMVRNGGVVGMGSPIPFAHSTVYGYNGLAPGPAMPFPSTMYGPGGPIPYMVDSRGVPVVPQILGSSSALPATYSQQPFLVGMTASPASSGIGLPRNGFDLNTGSMLEGGSRDRSSLGQLFNSSQVRSIDEQLKSNSQPSLGSVVGGKRKEPDSGWEPYPFKHYTPPWK